MDVPLIQASNTLSLISWLLGQKGQTFSEKCQTAIQEFDARINNGNRGSDEWHQLMRARAQIEGFIRLDREHLIDWCRPRQATTA